MALWPYNTVNWQRLRKAKLASDPLCEGCLREGKVIPADTVDHIKAINAGGDPFPPLSQLMSLCTPCHNRKTRYSEQLGRRTPVKGVDPKTGLPIDPQHWWNI